MKAITAGWRPVPDFRGPRGPGIVEAPAFRRNRHSAMSPNAFRALAALLAAALIGGGTQDPKPLTDGVVARLDGADIPMAA
jgi:hypothetical protein